MSTLFKERYPDQHLCFWLGCLPSGFFVALLASLVDFFFTKGGLADNLTFLTTALSYGVTGGAAGLLFGYLLRHIQVGKDKRWLWLSFVIPFCTLQLSIIEVEVVNVFECPETTFAGHDPTDILIGSCVYFAAALLSGFIAVIVLGISKWLRRKSSNAP